MHVHDDAMGYGTNVFYIIWSILLVRICNLRKIQESSKYHTRIIIANYT